MLFNQGTRRRIGRVASFVLTLTALSFATSAQAQFGPPGLLDAYGANASASVADCPSFCTNFNFAPIGGGQGITSDSASVSEARGNSAAFAALDLSSGLSMPLLRAEAFVLNSGGGAFASAFAVEAYTYTGTGTQTFNLDIDLDGEIFDPTPADGETSIVADIYIFEEFGFQFISDLGTLLFESGATEVTSTRLELSATGTTSGSLSFDLAAGESIYLWTLLDVDAERDMSYADAFSTLTTNFQDNTGLVAASPIPEPGTAMLIGFGLAGLAARRLA
ncbi:MAG: PEP-CTERM sorting domain-containing protein [Myxococcota bacterium]